MPENRLSTRIRGIKEATDVVSLLRGDTELTIIKISLGLVSLALISACSLFATNEPQNPLPNDPLETSVVATVNALNSATPVPPISLPTEVATQSSPDPASPVASATASVSPTPSPVWGDFPAPTQESATAVPPPMPEISFGPDVLNVLLMGTDLRPGTGGYRTDAMIVLSIDPGDGTATMISFPRDLYVYIPGWRMDRINTAMQRGGFEMASQTVHYNFGIPVDSWARMNFDGFISAVDTLGGITVIPTAYMRDECRGEILTYQPGSSYVMDGGDALCYVRMRIWGGDFDRMRRQQEVVQAVFEKLLTINGLSRVPQLYSQFSSNFATDIEVADLLPLIPTAVQIGADPSRISHYTVDRDLVNAWRTPSGGAVLLPKRDEIQLMLMEAFGTDAYSTVE